MNNSQSEPLRGVLFAVSCYLCWGLLPLYWKLLHSVAPIQILCHRIVWSAGLLLLILTVKRHWGWLEPFRRQPKKLAIFVLSSLTLSANWLLYIWAINHGRIVESSLGYYINPLINVLLGRILLGERLTPVQKLAVACAFAGVLWMTLQLGSFTWVALGLAISFGLYGLLRKQAPLPSLEGLSLETLLLAPLALIALLVFEWKGDGNFGHTGMLADGLLIGAGVVTAIPLIFFAHGARRLTLASMGIIQYISPTLQLLIGVMLYHEPFDHAHAIGFCLIWAGLVMYTLVSLFSLLQAPSADRG
jgi:chloramphenicol-sensitive protein RarD